MKTNEEKVELKEEIFGITEEELEEAKIEKEVDENVSGKSE